MKKEGMSVLLALIAVLLCQALASAQATARKVTELVRVGLTINDRGTDFGQALALTDETLVIGAPRVSILGENAGAVFVYKNTPGSIEEPSLLIPSDASSASFFGNAVAIDGDRIVVGSRGTGEAGPWTGSAYVFERNGEAWTEQAKLIAASQTAFDLFGNAVAISGDTILVGARWKGIGVAYLAGAVFIYERLPNGRYTRVRLVGDAVGDMFGESLAIEGDTIAIGAWSADAQGLDSGAVHVYRRQGSDWVQEALLSAEDGAPFDHFGSTLALKGDLLVVGAEGDDETDQDRGSAYVFERLAGAWTQSAKLEPSDGQLRDQFGTAVAIGTDVILVGSPAHPNPSGGIGAIYRFERQGNAWLETKIEFGDGNLGSALAASGGQALSTDANGAGSVQIFDLQDPSMPKLDAIRGSGLRRLDGRFGTGLAILGELVIGGDPGSDQDDAGIQVQNGKNPIPPTHIIDTQIRQRGIGRQIAAQGNVFVAAGDEDAWIYERQGDGWVLAGEAGFIAQITDPLPEIAVAVDRERVFVSAPRRQSSNQLEAGLVLCFEKNPAGSWALVQTISRGVTGENLGRSIAVCGDRLFLGTSGISNVVYVYELQASIWVEVDSVSGEGSSEEFGFDLACADEVLIVGAPGRQNSSGTAYIYLWDGAQWESKGRITGSTAGPIARFGEAVAIHDDTVLVGAPDGNSPFSSTSGTAYVFARNGDQWLETEQLGTATRFQSRFGAEIAMSEGVWAIGASSESTGGAVYRYDDPAYELSYGSGCPGSAGVPRFLPKPGSQPILGQTFSADLSNIPAGSPSVAMIGFSRSNWLGFSLPFALEEFAPGCVLHSSAEIRVALSNNSGSAELNLDIPDEPSLQGLRLYTQAVVGEVGVNPMGLTFSNALELVIRK